MRRKTQPFPHHADEHEPVTALDDQLVSDEDDSSDEEPVVVNNHAHNEDKEDAPAAAAPAAADLPPPVPEPAVEAPPPIPSRSLAGGAAAGTGGGARCRGGGGGGGCRGRESAHAADWWQAARPPSWHYNRINPGKRSNKSKQPTKAVNNAESANSDGEDDGCEQQADDATPPSHAKGYNLFLREERDGYKGVCKNGAGFRAKRQRFVGDKQRCLGTYQTAVEAAVAYAKDAAGDGVFPDTEANKDEPSGGDDDKDDRREQQQADEDVAPPSAEGYTLFLSKNATGFKGVYKAGGRFIAQRKSKHPSHLGSFSTAVKAAVAAPRTSRLMAAAVPPLSRPV